MIPTLDYTFRDERGRTFKLQTRNFPVIGWVPVGYSVEKEGETIESERWPLLYEGEQ